MVTAIQLDQMVAWIMKCTKDLATVWKVNNECREEANVDAGLAALIDALTQRETIDAAMKVEKYWSLMNAPNAASGGKVWESWPALADQLWKVSEAVRFYRECLRYPRT